MSVTKVNADVLDLTDAYALSGTVAFSGTVTGDNGGAWQFVSAVTASSSATVSFTGMATGYDHLVTMSAVAPATDSQYLIAQLGVTGPTYRTSNYLSIVIGMNASSGAVNKTSDTADFTLHSTVQGSAADETAHNEIILYDNAAATDTYASFHGTMKNASGVGYTSQGGGFHNEASAKTAIQFKYDSGNIAAGFFKLYRRANA